MKDKYGRYNYGYGYGSGYGYDNGNFQETIKILRSNIQFAGIDNPIKTICVTSSIPDEGKSTISHFLAIEMAKAGKKTLIVECDMRRPSQGNMFKLKPEKGLTAYLSGEATLEEVAFQTETDNLFLLDIDARVLNPVELLDSKKFHKAILEMRDKFDMVIFDTLPTALYIDSSVVAAKTDATIMIVRKGKADRRSIESSIEQLQKANANIIGIVFNDADSGYGIGSYGYKKYGKYGSYSYNYAHRNRKDGK